MDIQSWLLSRSFDCAQGRFHAGQGMKNKAFLAFTPIWFWLYRRLLCRRVYIRKGRGSECRPWSCLLCRITRSPIMINPDTLCYYGGYGNLFKEFYTYMVIFKPRADKQKDCKWAGKELL